MAGGSTARSRVRSTHLWFLIGFRNRVFVLFQWLFHYLTKARGTRLITATPTEARFLDRVGVAPPDIDSWPLNEADPERPED